MLLALALSCLATISSTAARSWNGKNGRYANSSSLVKGNSAGFSALRASTTGQQAPATVNALNATLKWWYTSPAYDQALTLSIQYDPADDVSTGWTALTSSTSYNVRTAISTSHCATPVTTTLSGGDVYSWTDCSTSVYYVAPSTSAVSVKAYLDPATSTGTSDLPNLQITPPPAIATVGSNTFSSGTNFVYFSRYEIVSERCRSHGFCSQVSKTYKLPSAYAFSYTGPVPPGPSNDRAISGLLPADFPHYINRTSLVPGSWKAYPVVVVEVQEIVVAIAVLAEQTVLSSQSTLDLPTPRLPPGFSQLPPTGTTLPNILTATSGPRIMTTQSWLLVPLPRTTAMTAPQTTTAVLETHSVRVTTTQALLSQPTQVAGIYLTPCLVTVDAQDSAITHGALTQGDRVVTAWYSGSMTIYPGAPAISMGDMVVSLAPSGGSISVARTSENLPAVVSTQTTFTTPRMTNAASTSSGISADNSGSSTSLSPDVSATSGVQSNAAAATTQGIRTWLVAIVLMVTMLYYDV